MSNTLKTIKTILFLILSTLAFSQNTQINYGQIDYSGYTRIIEGAFYKTRPEAAIIAAGGQPAGCEVFTLPEPYFVSFAEGNYSAGTRNYIVFPAGAKVYKKDGIFFAVKCANKIAHMVPVNNVKIIYRTKTVRVTDTVIQTRTVYVEPEAPAPAPAPAPAVAADCQQGLAMFNQLVGQYQNSAMLYKKAQQQLMYLQSAYPCLQGMQIVKINKTGTWFRDNAVGLANLALNTASIIVDASKNNSGSNTTIIYKPQPPQPAPTPNNGDAGYHGGTGAAASNAGYNGGAGAFYDAASGKAVYGSANGR